MDIRFIWLSVFAFLFKKKEVYISSQSEICNVHLLLAYEKLLHRKREKLHQYDEVSIGYNETKASNSLGGMECIKLLMNKYNLKVRFTQKEKIKMRVICGDNFLFYRIFEPDSSEEALINIANWEDGKYNVEFIGTCGTVIASGAFSIV